MRWFSLFLTFLVLTVAGVCDSDRALRLGPVHTETSGRLDVLVEIPEGVAAGPGDFQLLEDGRATVQGAELRSLKESGWATAAVLVVDTSGSMKKKIEFAKKALPEFVGQFQGPLALVTFGDEPIVVAAFDAPRDQLLADISQLRAVSKQTRLYAAVDTALGLLEKQPQPERQRIILVSDGEEESEQDSNFLDGVINKASSRRVAIDTIWTARTPSSSRDTMVRLSERTGGVHGDVRNADEVWAVLGQVVERTNDARIVSFNRKVGDGWTRELGLSLNQAGIEPASMALAKPIPQSTPPSSPGEKPSEGKGPSWWEILQFIWKVISDLRSWFKAAAAVGSAYAVYTASYVAVRRYRPEDLTHFPFSPFTLAKPVPVEDSKTKDEGQTGPDGKKAARRVTIVDHGPSARSSVLVLEAVAGPLKGERITIDKDYFSIGADPDNDLSISPDEFLSSKHAAIRASDAGWVLFDQGSTNGTFVDGKELKGETTHILLPGEVIRLGDSEFQVASDDFAKAASAASRQSQTRLT